MRATTILSSMLLALSLVGASAQNAPMPNRIHGTVEGMDGDVLKVKTTDGQESSIKIPANLAITALVNRKLSDIKAGDYVGSAAVQGADGKLHAQEVHIFSETMRGAGEGHRPMSGPNQSMTNATVTTVLSAPEGQVLKLQYKGGEQDIEVGPDARIVEIIPGDKSLLVPGAAVSVFVNKQGDGSLTARGIQAEKDGVLPL